MPKSRTPTNWDEVPLVVDIPYVSLLLDADPETIRRYLSSGKLKGFKIGKSWKILKEDVIGFVGAKPIA